MILWQILPLSLFYILLISSLCILNNITFISDYFLIDSFGIILSIIPSFILFSLINPILSYNNLVNSSLIIISCISSCICFNSSNFILFFISYELSIIMLLFSLFTNSPYSERSMAGWYFLGYLVFGGIPLLIMCLYISLDYSDYTIYTINNLACYGLFIIFITKVPLFPFHAWLPIVHAEANSFISIMLSGYIMKLGLLGILRFYFLSCENIKVYLFIFFSISCFFFISCFCELDNKRWLAFLSLGHISIGMGGLFSLNVGSNNVLSTFSLGHGLSVFILFYFFYCYSNVSGSRNWIVSILHNNNISNLILILGLLSLISFPPCILFFNEVVIFLSMYSINLLIVIFGLYLFLSILGPISNISIISSRLNNNVVYGINNSDLIIVFSSILLFFFITILL